ncbi:hypothetical protein QZQ15_17645 [Serratia marcescens]|uniref:hypothetical protein n=1 Tax=Serratia marcescens TaxID=615 RepID=UPI0027913838|nr:hypothetical protein [Serratia marcescens]MDP8799822.1 hypothetical protein [Serratia marcescens]
MQVSNSLSSGSSSSWVGQQNATSEKLVDVKGRPVKTVHFEQINQLKKSVVSVSNSHKKIVGSLNNSNIFTDEQKLINSCKKFIANHGNILNQTITLEKKISNTDYKHHPSKKKGIEKAQSDLKKMMDEFLSAIKKKNYTDHLGTKGSAKTYRDKAVERSFLGDGNS